MSAICVVGYCPELYNALQTVAHQEIPYEPIDDWPPHARQYNESDRQILIGKLFSALGGESLNNPLDKEFEHYLNALFEAIDDVELKNLIIQGDIAFMMINENGYYLAEQR